MLHNNHAAPERSIYLIELQKLSASGERDRWAASYFGGDDTAILFVSIKG